MSSVANTPRHYDVEVVVSVTGTIRVLADSPKAAAQAASQKAREIQNLQNVYTAIDAVIVMENGEAIYET